MLQTTFNAFARRPFIVAVLAGSAAATAPGCAITESHAGASPEGIDSPRSETFYAAAPVTITDTTRPTPSAMIDTSALQGSDEFPGLSNNTWADIGDGWTMVNAAVDAEVPAPIQQNVSGNTYTRRTFQNLENDGTLFTNDPFASRVSRSGDVSADLYDNVLGGALPREASFADQGKNTENVRQVTFTHFGADFDPMISRDGKKVIYASTQHRETADIYIKDVNSRLMTRLTNDAAQDVMPCLSPDGNFIAFASNRSGSWDLYMMPSTGGTPVQLTNDITHDLHPSWSPDGSKLVFSRLGQASGRWELWVMDMHNAAGLQFIGYGLFPEWSPVPGNAPDGSDQIVFQRSRERGDRAFSVWTIDYTDAPGKAMRETEIVNSPTHALINPSWAPDGEFVLYASVPNVEAWKTSGVGSSNQTDLWMIGNDGRGSVKLVGGTSINLMPVWGSNNEIFFVSDRSGVENLWAINVSDAVMTANAQRPGAVSNTGFAASPTDSE